MHQMCFLIFSTWETSPWPNIWLTSWTPDVTTDTCSHPCEHQTVRAQHKACRAGQWPATQQKARFKTLLRHLKPTPHTPVTRSSCQSADPKRLWPAWDCEGCQQRTPFLGHRVQRSNIQEEPLSHPSCCRATATTRPWQLRVTEHRPFWDGHCSPLTYLCPPNSQITVAIDWNNASHISCKVTAHMEPLQQYITHTWPVQAAFQDQIQNMCRDIQKKEKKKKKHEIVIDLMHLVGMIWFFWVK